MSTPLYDSFSKHYDRFVNWDHRLGYELPFIERQLAAAGARRLLDSACGTGRHAIALAGRGYQVVGTDVSTGMIQRARTNGLADGVDIMFAIAGFGGMAPVVGGEFDAALCLGNSLPHLLTLEALVDALQDFRQVLRSDGLLLIQNRNYDRVMRGKGERWMEPQSQCEGGTEWLFVRFYDYGQDGTLTFNVMTLSRAESGTWNQEVGSTLLRPWRKSELEAMILASGFRGLAYYGDMTGAAYSPLESENLIVAARRG